MTISKPALSGAEGAVAALTVVLAIGMWWVLPHADFPAYGRFADDRDGNTARNVVSNLGLLIVGTAGVWWAMRNRQDDRAAALILFAGVIAAGLGSMYFHAQPLAGGRLNRAALLWDRMPMTIAFAGLIALVLRDRVLQRPNRFVLPLLVVIGLATALYWYWSGDLYPYAFFQFYTAAGTLLMIMTLRPRYTEAGYVAAAVVLFGMSKVFEDFDWAIHAGWGIGGHPLKHAVSALAAVMILLWLAKRRARA